jgi:hypothetical protein
VTGSAQDQVALAHAYAAWEAAQQLATSLKNVWMQVAADRAHAELLLAAMRCGFEPAGSHKHISLVDWTGRRVRLVQAILPDHLTEAARAA